jgi:hypothetical protein
MVFASIILAVFAMGCSHTVSRSISEDQVGTKYAQLEGYFRAVDMVEEVPGDIRHEAVIDEATLSRVGDGETCMQVKIRTSRRYDEPISQLSPTCQSGAEEAEAIAVDEIVSVYDYSYAGRVETVAVDAVAADKYLGLSISEPAEKIFRVIERESTVCCPVMPQGEMELSFKNKRMDYNNVAYKLAFDWKLQ